MDNTDHYSITPALQFSSAPRLHYSSAAALHHSTTPVLQHSVLLPPMCYNIVSDLAQVTPDGDRAAVWDADALIQDDMHLQACALQRYWHC